MRKLFLLAIVLCVWSVVADAQESEGRYIEVTGSSEIEVVPDEIHLLIQIKEYWKEEFVPKSKPEDYKTKVPLEWIEKDLRRVLSRAGISDEAIRVQEIGDYWRQKGKEFLIGKQLDIRFTDFEKINAVIKKIDTKAAREKASYLVEAMGQKLGEVIRIVEPASSYVSPYSLYQAQSNVSMGTAATEQYRVIKLRYEMTARFAIE